SESIVELRSTGCQTIFPGSIHASGERIEWAVDDAPTVIEAAELLAAVDALAAAVEAKLGVVRKPIAAPAPSPVPPTAPVQIQRERGAIDNTVDRARKYLAAMPPAISGAGGHNQTFAAACVVACGFDLGREDALALMREYNARCTPPWSERELEHKVDQALKTGGPRGYLRDAD